MGSTALSPALTVREVFALPKSCSWTFGCTVPAETLCGKRADGSEDGRQPHAGAITKAASLDVNASEDDAAGVLLPLSATLHVHSGART